MFCLLVKLHKPPIQPAYFIICIILQHEFSLQFWFIDSSVTQGQPMHAVFSQSTINVQIRASTQQDSTAVTKWQLLRFKTNRLFQLGRMYYTYFSTAHSAWPLLSSLDTKWGDRSIELHWTGKKTISAQPNTRKSFWFAITYENPQAIHYSKKFICVHLTASLWQRPFSIGRENVKCESVSSVYS